jgi:hypothetical protein
MTLAHSASSFRSASLLGSLALGFGLSLVAMTAGCSSDEAAATTTETEGGAGSGTAGAAGSSGTAGSGGGAAGSATGGLCPHPQMSSEIGDHCVADGGAVIKTPADECLTTPGDAAAAGDGGEEDYPGPHSGTTSDDDDCKYDVSYGVACEPGGLSTFTVSLKSRVTGMGVPGANPSIEASFDDTPHPLPNTPKPVTTDLGMGNYKIAGVPLDKEGGWTVRFHFFEQCLESENTKHGHVAFTVFYR